MGTTQLNNLQHTGGCGNRAADPKDLTRHANHHHFYAGIDEKPTAASSSSSHAAAEAVSKLLLRWRRRIRLALQKKDQTTMTPRDDPLAVARRATNGKDFAAATIGRVEYENPVVSFVNQGDGSISVDLSHGRVMHNESELYAMAALSTLQQHPARGLSAANLATLLAIQRNQAGSTSSCEYGSAMPLRPDATLDCDNQQWYFRNLPRDECVAMLAGMPIGTFAVRPSISRPGCYALSVSVQVQVQPSGVAHYLIIGTSHGTFKIKVKNF